MKAIKRIDVQLSGNTLPTPVKVVAGDTAIQLILHYTDFTIPDGTTATLFVMKPSKKFVYQTEDIIVDGNTVTIDVKNQAIIERGEAYFTVTLTNGDDKVSTFSNYFDVDRNYSSLEAEESKTIIGDLISEEMIEDYINAYLAENSAITDEQLGNAISAYFAKNPITGGSVSADQIAQAVANYFVENPVKCEVSKEEFDQLSETKVDNPSTGAVGQILEIESVDENGKPKTYKAVDKPQGGSGGTVVSSVEPMEDDIPKVFFSEAIPQTKDDTVTKFRYISKTKDISGFAEFKAHGNSSMNYAKKNMTVKMYADETLEEKLKVDFKNWGEQRKHVYKANWIDLTHARNVVSARIWADVVKSREDYLSLPELLRTSPNQGAVDGFPVKVYSQGIYQGRYTLNIPKDAWMANMDDSLDEHCILCGEGYNSGCFRSASMGEWTDEVHDTRPTLITNRWLEVINFVMNSTDEEFKTNLGNYFFVDSLIDYFIFGMVQCGLDAFGKNQLYFTYDGVKWIASMYDMDATWGLYWNGSKFVSASYSREEFEDFVSGRQGNLLYIRLASLFYEEIQSRYEELKQGVLSIPNIINHFERFTDIASLDLVKEDYASTTGSGKFTGIPSIDTNNIQQIRKFVVDRYVYCDEYFASLTPELPVPATGITLDKATLTFTDSTTQTIIATVEPENTTDTVVWISNNEEVAKVSNGVVTPIKKGSCTITATVGSVSAVCEVTVDIEEIVAYTITRNLTNCTSSNAVTSINEGSAHTESITPDSGYTLDGATVTVTMGGTDISTSFVNGVLTIDSVTGDIVITVSAEEEVEEPDETLIYSLPEATTFNGTSDFIDTGVNLFNPTKDFSFFIEFSVDEGCATNANIMHNVKELTPYCGVNVVFTGDSVKIYNSSAVYSNVFSYGKTFKIGFNYSCESNTMAVFNGTNLGGFVDQVATGTNDGVTVNQTMLLGAYQTTDGSKGRYFKGTINRCMAWSKHLTEEEFKAL